MFPGTPFCSRLTVRIFSVLTLAALLAPSAAKAQSSFTWTGGGGDNNWTTGGNWGGTAPTNPQAYINFNGTTRTTANNNFANGSPGFQIYFNNGAGAFTLTGNSINFYDYNNNSPLIQNDSSNLQTVQIGINAEYSNMNFLANAGNMTLSTSSITVVNGGALNFTTNSGKTLTIGDTVNGTTSGVFVNSNFGSTSSGGGTVVFAGTNTYVGGTTLNGGTLQLGNGGSTGSIVGTNTITFNAGSGTSASSATLAINLTSNNSVANTLATASASTYANVAVASATTATLTGAVTGAGEFWTTGAGTLVVAANAGSASRSASNVVSTGTLSVADLSSSTLGSGGIFIVNGNLTYTGASTSTTRIGGSSLQSATSAIGVTTSGATLTLGNDLGGFAGGGLTKTGAGNLALTAANSYTGGTTVSAGAVYLNNTTGSGAGTGSMTVAAGATLGGTGSYGTTASKGAGFSVAGTGTATGQRANIAVGQANATDTNTTSTLGMIATATSTITNANLTFNINDQVKGQGNELNVGNTAIAFGSGVQATTLTLNVQNTGVIALNTAYILLAGSTSGGTDQYTGLSLGTATGTLATGLTTRINNSGVGGSGNLTLSMGGLANTWYGNGSYLALYQNSVTGADDIEVIVVPEPTTWALTIGGLATLIAWQRNKRKRND